MEKSKATAGFHEAIEKYLDARAESDEQWRVSAQLHKGCITLSMNNKLNVSIEYRHIEVPEIGLLLDDFVNFAHSIRENIQQKRNETERRYNGHRLYLSL